MCLLMSPDPFWTKSCCSCCFVCLCGYLRVKGWELAVIQGENVSSAWDDFSTLLQTPFCCKVQMSCNKKALRRLIRSSRAGRKQEPIVWTETLFWNINDSCSNRDARGLCELERLQGDAPALTPAAQSGAVRRSEVTAPAAGKHTAPSRGEKSQRRDRKR